MRAKSAIIALFVLTIALSAAYGESSGIRAGLEFGEPNAVLILRLSPFDFKLGYSFVNPFLFVSADYRILDGRPLFEFLHYFLSAGAFAKINFTGSASAFEAGLRIPVGLQMFLMDGFLELFLEVAPTVNFMNLASFPLPLQGYIGFTILVPKFW